MVAPHNRVERNGARSPRNYWYKCLDEEDVEIAASFHLRLPRGPSSRICLKWQFLGNRNRS
jgi:hypothetical protein